MVIDDNYILSFFYGKKTYRRSLIHKYENFTIDDDITKYCKHRYPDSDSLKETIFRIKHHIEIKPICKQCGKSLHFVHGAKAGFPYRFCCCTCAQLNRETRETYKNTCLKKYGTNNPTKLDNVQHKMKQTTLERYGVENVFQSDLIKEKIKNTLKSRYNVDNIRKSAYMIKRLNDNKDKIVEKRNNTKKINKTFNTSKPEEECYEFLVSKFNNVKRQYTSINYHFACDFYIPNIDTYVELNNHWTHGKHPYDKNSLDDNKLVEYWKSKHTKFYDNAIKTWTIRDVNKVNDANKNNIKLLVFYSKDDLINYFS